MATTTACLEVSHVLPDMNVAQSPAKAEPTPLHARNPNGCRYNADSLFRDQGEHGDHHHHHHENETPKHKGLHDLLRTDHNTQRLTIFAVLLFLFFFLEIIFAIITSSVSLLSDAFHMLTDLSATCLAIYAIVLSNRPDNDQFTYGLSRAQVLGGLANGIFLLSVTFMLSVEVCMKLVHTDELSEIDGHGLAITYVGAAGLAVNIIGMFLLGGHGHSHVGGGGGGHSHESQQGHHGHEADHHAPHEEKSHGDLNMRAAWLHALGDTLGSVVVVAVGLVVHFAEGDWKYYMDPLLTAVILVIITYSAVPLVRNCCQILAQGVPQDINVESVKDDLFSVDEGIIDIHDLHIWQLEPGNYCGSVHVIFGKEFHYTQFSKTAEKLKCILHKHDVHSVAIQPEFSEHSCHDTSDCEVDRSICCTTMSCLLPCRNGCNENSVCCTDRERTRTHKRSSVVSRNSARATGLPKAITQEIQI